MNPKYSVHETGPRIEQFLRQIIARRQVRSGLRHRSRRPQPSRISKIPDIIVKFNGARCGPAAGESRRTAAGARTGHAGSAAAALRRSFAHFLRCQRLPRAAHRRTAHERAWPRPKKSSTPARRSASIRMNSRERRVIHIALRNEHELRSESAGSGPFRHVVIYPAGMPSLPDPAASAAGSVIALVTSGDRPAVIATATAARGRPCVRGGPDGRDAVADRRPAAAQAYAQSFETRTTPLPRFPPRPAAAASASCASPAPKPLDIAARS